MIGGSVDEDFGTDDVPEGKEHLHEFSVAEFLGKMIDEEVATLGAGDGAACKGESTARSALEEDPIEAESNTETESRLIFRPRSIYYLQHFTTPQRRRRRRRWWTCGVW